MASKKSTSGGLDDARKQLRFQVLNLAAAQGGTPSEVVTRAKKYEAYLDGVQTEGDDPNDPDSGPG